MPGQPLPHARAQWPGSGERPAMYGLAKETWNHADWNRFYHAFCVTATTASRRWRISAMQSGRQPALRRLA